MHVLIGKILRHSDPNNTYCVSRITHELGNSAFLAVRLKPLTGEELLESHVIHVSGLTHVDGLFDDFSALRKYIDVPPPEDAANDLSNSQKH
jgi:hypothetical protein